MLRLLFILFFASLQGIEGNKLQNALSAPFPFSYPMQVQVITGKGPDVLLFFHGTGSNYELAHVIDAYKVVSDHLVSFNFPDYDCFQRKLPQSKITQGTIQQLLPPLCILKRLIVDHKLDKISLYGFSSGGGAIVNMIAVLNTSKHDEILSKYGIGEREKTAILSSIQKGIILLDAPLKSETEIHEVKGNNDFYVNLYRSNQMEPISNLPKWQGLNLSVIVFFQNPDQAVCNRDNDLFAEQLRRYNSGKSIVLSSDEGGHLGFHASIWKAHGREKSPAILQDPSKKI